MTTATISFYSKFALVHGTSTPKYTLVELAGYYPPMQDLVGKDGRVSFFLTDCLSDDGRAPAKRLQGKNSLNVTGLKNLFTKAGELSGYAYGYPLDKETYSKKKTPNPFFKFRDDGFLFLFEKPDIADGLKLPKSFEMLVLNGGKILIASYAEQLRAGGFEKALEALRGQAKKL